MGDKLKLAYDDDCGFCTLAVRWLAGRRFVRETELELVAYQHPNLLKRMPGVDVSHSGDGVQLLFEDGHLYLDAAAVGEIFKRTQYWWCLGWMIRLPLAAQVAQVCYRVVAVNRQRISRLLGLNACHLSPRPDESRSAQ
jgi:predicted DCC family thiol-disulfide oxidoreductase YuxK